MALDRAGCGRQVLTFDAAVPIFVNRPILAMTPGAEKNILEHYLLYLRARAPRRRRHH